MTPGTVDLNGLLRNGGRGEGTEVESDGSAEPGGVPQATGATKAPAPRHHRLDDNELSGFGRLAVDPRTQTSRKSGEDYTVLRIAQNIRAIGPMVVTNYFDLMCFGGAHHVAAGLVVGQEVYFRGTFIQEPLLRPGQPVRLVNKVIVDYLRPVARSRSSTASP